MQLNNAATSVSFGVVYKGETPTDGQLVYALCDRLLDLMGDDQSEIGNALWDPWDVHTEDADVLWQNGIDPTPALTKWEMRVLVRTIRQITDRKKGRHAA